ncbi:YveK family protein [Sulfobacillus harzensis]|uniref:Polysaccharide chain length determinant N-terminal domain-containing protein n=1 Tax=Sulfobacillus harzensis TaxID=2729629 RepID=A0A7Y0Q323_9FIRM|nr:Wzz/FepE/Etk N-terminal domain-containing protein [Sulfobacillus harzensis]NMP22955.1 hypothetical protein [Sulfobacillus harzensis]
MELLEVWKTIRRRLWLVLLMAVLAGGTAASLCRWYLPKMYASTATLMVIPGSDSGAGSGGGTYIDTLVAAQQMVATYAALAESPEVLSQASQGLTNAPSPTALSHDVTAAAESGTNLMTVTVRANSPLLAQELANGVAQTLSSTVARVTGQSGLKVVASAKEQEKPVSPRTLRTTATGLALGLILGLLMSFIWNSLDDAIRREEEIVGALSCASLGVISRIPEAQGTAKRVASHAANPQRSVSS